MNAAKLFLLPWWGAPTLTRGLIGGLLAILMLIFIVVAAIGRLGAREMYGAWCFIDLLAWALLMPNALVLARDARALRLPALERDAVLSLIVYAVALIVVPGLLIPPPASLTSVQTLLSFALFAAVPLAYMCLPGYLAAFIIVGWLILNQLSPNLAAVANMMNFTVWAAPMLLVLLLAIAWSWRRTVRGAIAAASHSAPMVLKLRMSAWKGSDKADIAQVRQRPDWLRAQPDLRRCGPEFPQQSLRVVLGGLFLPQRWTSRLRTWLWAVLWSSLFVAFMMLQAWSRHPQTGWLWRAGLFATLAWGIGFGASMVALISVLRLGRVWQNVTGELPLLALLPGLGARGDLLRAMLTPPLYTQLPLLALSLICALSLHLHPAALAFVLLTQVGAIAFVVVFVLLIAGGKLPNKWLVSVLGCAGFVLVSVSLFVPTLSDASTIRLPAGNLADWLIAGWLALGAILFCLGLRGWRGLVQRPHPFLPNGT